MLAADTNIPILLGRKFNFIPGGVRKHIPFLKKQSYSCLRKTNVGIE